MISLQPSCGSKSDQYKFGTVFLPPFIDRDSITFIIFKWTVLTLQKSTLKTYVGNSPSNQALISSQPLNTIRKTDLSVLTTFPMSSPLSFEPSNLSAKRLKKLRYFCLQMVTWSKVKGTSSLQKVTASKSSSSLN